MIDVNPHDEDEDVLDIFLCLYRSTGAHTGNNDCTSGLGVPKAACLPCLLWLCTGLWHPVLRRYYPLFRPLVFGRRSLFRPPFQLLPWSLYGSAVAVVCFYALVVCFARHPALDMATTLDTPVFPFLFLTCATLCRVCHLSVWPGPGPSEPLPGRDWSEPIQAAVLIVFDFAVQFLVLRVKLASRE